MTTESEVSVQFGPCCFCNQEIERSDVDPCCVTVETVDGSWQVWRCHARCFRERVFSRDDGLFDPANF